MFLTIHGLFHLPSRILHVRWWMRSEQLRESLSIGESGWTCAVRNLRSFVQKKTSSIHLTRNRLFTSFSCSETSKSSKCVSISPRFLSYFSRCVGLSALLNSSPVSYFSFSHPIFFQSHLPFDTTSIEFALLLVTNNIWGREREALPTFPRLSHVSPFLPPPFSSQKSAYEECGRLCVATSYSLQEHGRQITLGPIFSRYR